MSLPLMPAHPPPPPAPPAPPPPPQPQPQPELVVDNTQQYQSHRWLDAPFASDGAHVEVIDRLEQGVWRPFLMVAPSVLLKANGIDGLGLYSLRHYSAASTTKIGQYTGEVLKTFSRDTPDDEVGAKQALFAQKGKRHLAMIRLTPGGGWSIVDGLNGGLPRLSMINDGRNMVRPGGEAGRVANNVTFGGDGRGGIFKMKKIAIPAADLNANALDWRSELRLSYSKEYWGTQDAVGTSDFPQDVESDEEAYGAMLARSQSQSFTVSDPHDAAS